MLTFYISVLLYVIVLSWEDVTHVVTKPLNQNLKFEHECCHNKTK